MATNPSWLTPGSRVLPSFLPTLLISVAGSKPSGTLTTLQAVFKLVDRHSDKKECLPVRCVPQIAGQGRSCCSRQAG